MQGYTPLVEPLSLDEAFLDVRGCENQFGPAPAIARLLKDRIRAETGLTASVGVAPNKFLAKLAGEHGKPDGLVVLPPEGVTSFLAPLPVGRLWGVGGKAEKRLRALGIRTVGELAARPEKLLREHFGAAGAQLWELAHGRDSRAVVPDREAKSLSVETTFDHDLRERAVLRRWLLQLTDQLAARLRRAGVKARAVEVKVRSADFRTRSCLQSLPAATDGTEELWRAARALFERAVTVGTLPVRLLGVGAARLARGGAEQGTLFGDEDAAQRRALDRAVDTIRGRFGAGAIRRGDLLDGDGGGNRLPSEGGR